MPLENGSASFEACGSAPWAASAFYEGCSYMPFRSAFRLVLLPHLHRFLSTCFSSSSPLLANSQFSIFCHQLGFSCLGNPFSYHSGGPAGGISGRFFFFIFYSQSSAGWEGCKTALAATLKSRRRYASLTNRDLRTFM